jgi:hypothetical protein
MAGRRYVFGVIMEEIKEILKKGVADQFEKVIRVRRSDRRSTFICSRATPARDRETPRLAGKDRLSKTK